MTQICVLVNTFNASIAVSGAVVGLGIRAVLSLLGCNLSERMGNTEIEVSQPLFPGNIEI